MLWGCITYTGIGWLVSINSTFCNLNSAKHIDLLGNHLWPVIVKEFGNRPFIFQDDNATPYVSRQTSTWKIENGFPKRLNLHDLHNLRTLTLSKMSGAVSKSNYSVKLTQLKNDKI